MIVSDNNTTRVRREILVRMAKLAFENKLIEKIDRIPLDMRPKNSSHDRCCIYKERAVIKYRQMAMLGFNIEDETDELKPLSEYAREALERKEISGTNLTVITESCSACVKASYFITNACRGCFARPCAINCPKKCISFTDGQAHIDPAKCVSCGKCMNVCPYHAVVYVPVPCEQECPVGAIAKDEDGKEIIDDEKCILCGKCISACPYGAIADKSQAFDVIKHLMSREKVIAMVAPSIVGQFDAPLEKLAGALKAIGFDDVYEVALGADITAKNEAAELNERLENGESFMTTSCCPAYVQAVKKHISELLSKVSNTGTPLYYTSNIAAERHPGAVKVFIGPCAAKKSESENNPNVDYSLTFEEIGSLFVAKSIDVDDVPPASPADVPTRSGRGFPISGGVTAAVKDMAAEGSELREKIRPEFVNGITKQSLKMLKSYAKNGGDFNFLEVMCCEGGCVAGPCVIANPKRAARKVDEFVESSKPPAVS